MPATTVNITGTFNFPDASFAEYAKAFFYLSHYDVDENDFTILPEVIDTVLGSGGELDVDIWGNDDGVRGTTYGVFVKVFEDDQYIKVTRTFDLGKIQIVGNGPFAIDNLLNVPIAQSSVWYNFFDLSPEDVAEAVAAKDTAVAAANSAASDAASANLSETVATSAAIAAGAPIVTSLTDPVPANGTVELLKVDEGLQLHQVVSGAWAFQSWLTGPKFDTPQDLFNSPATTLGPVGQIIYAGPYAYKVAPVVAVNQHETTAGGVKLYVPTDQKITPFIWGAVEEPEGTFGGADQSDKLQKFLDFINDNTLLNVDWTGSFSIASPLTLGSVSEVKTMVCRGRLYLRAMNDMPGSVFKVDKLRADSIWGDLTVACFGGADYSIRKTPVAIEIGNTPRAKLGSWVGYNAQVWAVWATTDPGVKNSNLLKADKFAGHQCGSGVDVVNRSHKGVISSFIQYGTAGSTSQTTRISLGSFAELPPANIENYGIKGTTNPVDGNYTSNDSNPIFIEVGGRMFHVIHYDRVDAAVWTYPQIPDGTPLGSEFTWFFGGALGMIGGDTNAFEIGVLEAMNCGIGVSAAMLFGPLIGKVLVDSVGIGVHIGGNLGNSCIGTKIENIYIEGGSACKYHLLTSSIDCDFKIGYTSGDPQLTRIATTTNPKNASDQYPALWAPLQKGTLQIKDKIYRAEKAPNNALGSSVDFVLDEINMKRNYQTDTVTVNLSMPVGVNETTGIDGGFLTIIGTGANSSPTQVTFSPPSGDKINGGSVDANYVVTTFNGPGRFDIVYDVANRNWKVLSLIAENEVTPQSAPADPTGGSNIDAESRAAIASIIDKLQAAGVFS